MKQIISFDHSTHFVTDNPRLMSALLELLEGFQKASGTDLGATVSDIEYTIKTAPKGFGDRDATESHWKKEAEDNSTRWYKEYQKNQTLEKQLKELQAASLKPHYTTDVAYREDGGERIEF